MNTELFIVLKVFIFIIGLCIGSFLNVVALRAFSGESIVLPASKCPKCGEKIKPWDNIPVLSFLILRGKCRNCACEISMQYPIVEFLTGVGFLFFFTKFAPIAFSQPIMWQKIILLPFFLIIFALSVVITITDFKEKVVFDVHTISLIVTILLFQLIGGKFIPALFGLVAGIIIMEALSGVGWLFVRKRAFGTGDTYIAAAMGALLGPEMLVIALITGIIIQVLCIIPSFIHKLYKDGEFKLLISGGVFILFTILYKLPFEIWDNNILKYITVILMTVVGIYVCKLILTIKTLKENPTYWPFGPSLLIAMFLTAMYGGIIRHFYTTLIF